MTTLVKNELLTKIEDAARIYKVAHRQERNSWRTLCTAVYTFVEGMLEGQTPHTVNSLCLALQARYKISAPRCYIWGKFLNDHKVNYNAAKLSCIEICAKIQHSTFFKNNQATILNCLNSGMSHSDFVIMLDDLGYERTNYVSKNLKEKVKGEKFIKAKMKELKSIINTFRRFHELKTKNVSLTIFDNDSFEVIEEV